ncbi:MAG: flagellar hook-basal body complex protein FliE [Nitrospiraceae bacterium]|nr:flagellar hook-basal body complex protein FliE [Nitrospiraceae bacterium]
MEINGSGQLNGLAGLNSSQKNDGKGFDEMMNQAINEVSQVQQSADKAANDLANGGDMTQAIIEMQKANLNFQLMIEVRNKILSAYDQIMGMQI